MNFRSITQLGKALFITFLLSFSTQVLAQDTKLSFENIFTNWSFNPDYFGPARWVEEGAGYTTLEYSSAHQGYRELIRYETATGAKSILIASTDLIPSGQEKPLFLENYIWSEDKAKLLIFTNSKRVWRTNTKGDYWVYDLNKKSLRQLGKDLPASSLMFAKFSPDGSQVGYVSEHNIFVENLTTENIKQLTADGSEKIINGTFDWAYEEEFSCKDGFRWSPDNKQIAYWQLDASEIRDFLMINYTDSLYSYTIPVQYPKVGTPNSSCKVGVVNADGGATRWMNIKGDSKNNYIPKMQWAGNSDQIIVQQLNRRQDHNQVILCEIKTGDSKTIYEDKETTWLDRVDDWIYLNNGKNFTWVSEKSGWRKVYSIAANGQNEKPISTADFDMISVKLIDENNGWLYYTASPDNATQKYLYRNKLTGKGKPEKLTPAIQNGTHNYQISPDGKWAIHSYSNASTPDIKELISLPDHKVVRTLINNKDLKNKIKNLTLSQKEFFKIDTKDGFYLDAYIMKPKDFDPRKKYPMITFLYGEPWKQTVTDSWDSWKYLYHNLLTEQGYIVASIDNRGTPGPKGRDWRKSVHAKLGVLASKDQADGVKYMIEKYDFIDADRIGVWGWSGGGSMTLNMMFRYPELYKTGVSVAPVPDISLYDNIYQERYSGLMSEHKEDYIQSSPITHAKNLQGNLMIIHGTGDDNVHYQGTERLINELIKHNKMFSMMAYPNRSHGIYEGENTSRHVYETMFLYWLNNLEKGGK